MPCSSDAGLFDCRLNVVDIVNTYRGRLGLLQSVSTQVTLETIHYAVLSAAHQPALSPVDRYSSQTTKSNCQPLRKVQGGAESYGPGSRGGSHAAKTNETPANDPSIGFLQQ